MNTQTKITSTTELMEFIKKEDVTANQANEVVRKALSVYTMDDMSKDEIIEKTQAFINRFYPRIKGQERPLFLEID